MTQAQPYIDAVGSVSARVLIETVRQGLNLFGAIILHLFNQLKSLMITHMRYLIVLGVLMFPALHWYYDGDYKAVAASIFSVWTSITNYTLVAPSKWIW